MNKNYKDKTFIVAICLIAVFVIATLAISIYFGWNYYNNSDKASTATQTNAMANSTNATSNNFNATDQTASNQTTLDQPAKKLVWLAIGDSITAGEQDEGRSYVEYMAADHDIYAVKKALGGMRTNELVTYAKNGFIDTDEKPDFITVLMGTNDWGNNRTLAEFEADVSELMDILQSKYPESKIVFLTPLYRDHFGERTFIPSGMVNKNGNHLYEYSDIIKKQAAAHNIAVIELDENTYINADNLREYTADGLHPNTAGNKLIADRLYQPLMEVIQK